MAAIRAPVEQVVALSRANRDTEAYEARERLNAPFATIDQGVNTLIRINHESADRTVTEMDSLRRASSWPITTCAAR